MSWLENSTYYYYCCCCCCFCCQGFLCKIIFPGTQWCAEGLGCPGPTRFLDAPQIKKFCSDNICTLVSTNSDDLFYFLVIYRNFTIRHLPKNSYDLFFSHLLLFYLFTFSR